MEKLFKYSKVAASMYVFIFAILLIMELSHLLGFRMPPILPYWDYYTFLTFDIYQIFLDSLGKIVVLFWFVLIVKLSAKKSPLITPSIIGIVSQLLGIAQFAYIPVFSTISSMLYAILNIVTFIWVSSYFEKKSKLQIMSICLAFTPIMQNLTIAIDSLIGFIGVFILSFVLTQLLYIFFFVEFSKLNKN